MHGKKPSFGEKYRSKNAAKAKADEAQVREAMAPHHAKTKQLLGAPFEFISEVCRLTTGRMVAQCIYRRTIVCDCLTVTLPSGELARLGVNRQYKQKALIQLQRAGLIKVENVEGRTALVTLLWQEA